MSRLGRLSLDLDSMAVPFSCKIHHALLSDVLLQAHLRKAPAQARVVF